MVLVKSLNILDLLFFTHKPVRNDDDLVTLTSWLWLSTCTQRSLRSTGWIRRTRRVLVRDLDVWPVYTKKLAAAWMTRSRLATLTAPCSAASFKWTCGVVRSSRIPIRKMSRGSWQTAKILVINSSDSVTGNGSALQTVQDLAVIICRSLTGRSRWNFRDWKYYWVIVAEQYFGAINIRTTEKAS